LGKACGRTLLLSALAIAVGCVGCGEDTPPNTASSNPAAVSAAFVRAVASGDPKACESLTSSALRIVKAAGEVSSCEAAVEAQEPFVERVFYGTPPQDLADELDTGRLRTRGGGTEYRFCTPTEARVALELVESDGDWLIEAISATGVTVDDKLKPCNRPDG
jgi:hypothetical protein